MSKGTLYEHVTDLEMFLSFIKFYFRCGGLKQNPSDNQWKSFDNPIDELTCVWCMTWWRHMPNTVTSVSLVVEYWSWEIILCHFTSCLSHAFKHIKQFESFYFHVTKISCPYIFTRRYTDRWHWCWSKICWMWLYHNEELTLTYATSNTNHVYIYDIVGEGAFLP